MIASRVTIRDRSDVDADVLDSLRRLGRATVRALAEDTGRDYRLVSAALSRLLDDGVVGMVGCRRRGRSRPPAVWAETCPCCGRAL